MKRATKLSDVAEAARVDVSTVSRVLNNDPRSRVSKATKQRILSTAGKLGYRPNAMARGLRTSRTQTLAFAIPQIENPVFAQMFVGASTAARQRGYDLVMALVEDISGSSGVYERLAHTSRVDGLLVATAEPDVVLMKALKRASIPYVVVNRSLRGLRNCVAFDNIAATRKATEYLHSLGHRRIAHIAGAARDWNAERRIAGYRAALESAGIPADPQLVIHAGYTFDGGVKATQALLKLKLRPTAILAATTLTAAGALSALHTAGVGVPSDISVMGIHEVDVAGMLCPTLSTVGLPLRQMGEVAVSGLIDLLHGERTDVGCLLNTYEMNFRASTGRAPHY